MVYIQDEAEKKDINLDGIEYIEQDREDHKL